MIKALGEGIRTRYVNEDMLIRKKAVLLLYMNLFLVVFMALLVLSTTMLPVDKNQKMSAVLAGVPIITGALISLAALRYVSYRAGAMTLVVLLALGGGGALAGRP